MQITIVKNIKTNIKTLKFKAISKSKIFITPTSIFNIFLKNKGVLSISTLSSVFLIMFIIWFSISYYLQKCLSV